MRNKTYESVNAMPAQRYDLEPGTRVAWAHGHDYYNGKLIELIPGGVHPLVVARRHKGEALMPTGHLLVSGSPRFLVERTTNRQMHITRNVQVVR